MLYPTLHFPFPLICLFNDQFRCIGCTFLFQKARLEISLLPLPTLGYYVYVETSNTGSNQRGRIMKDYTGLKQGGSCLTFWYHMFGIHQGTLRVYTNATNTQPIFSVSGQQGNLWVKGEATITSTSAKVNDTFCFFYAVVRNL